MRAERYHAGDGYPIEPTGPDHGRFRSRTCDARMTEPGPPDPRPRLARFLDDLEWRGILHATTPGLPERLATGRRISAYIGFDPTADSLHIGHLIPIFGLLRLQRARRQARRARGWRHRDDRRPVRAVVGAEPARRRHARAQRRGDPGTARAVPGLLARAGAGRHGQQPRLAGVDLADRLPAGRRQALHRALHAGQGLRPDAPRARPVVHRVQLHDPPGASTSRRCTASTASRCRWAARTSGGTSPRASS